MIVWISAFSIATSRLGVKRKGRRRVPRQGVAARVHDIIFAPRLAACLKKVAATGWFSVGRAPITMITSASARRGERRRDRAGTDALHQGRHRGGVAEPRAMVDIVAAEPGADQLLEQIGLLVRALGRAEPGQRAGPVAIADALRPRRRDRAPPPSSPGGNACKGWPDRPGIVLRDAVLADQRLGQPVGVVGVVEAEAALDAEPVVVGRPVAALDRDDAVVLDLVGQLAADPAIGAERCRPRGRARWR